MQKGTRRSPAPMVRKRQWKTPSPKCVRIEEQERAHTEGHSTVPDSSLKSVQLEMRRRKVSQVTRDTQLQRLLAACLEETAPTEEAKDQADAPIPETSEATQPCCRLCIIS